MKPEDRTTIIQPGENCWKKAEVERGAIIIGGEDYFRAFREAILSARHRVLLIAWEIHTKVELLRGDDWKNCEDGYPQQLGDFMEAVLEDRPELHIHLLLWDFSPIYAKEREWPSFNEFLKNHHPRLHFAMDDQLPKTASHHQKMVVVDDVLAFCGGIDLSIWRWDTNENIVGDERRTTPEGEKYHPYHDTHTVVTGGMATLLRDHCRYRWERATGESLPPLQADKKEKALWPESIDPDFENEPGCLARTFSKFEPYDEIFEIEKLHLAAIEAANDYIFIENQYYSSPQINNALIEKLEDPDGPSIILILNKSAGWLENHTLGVVRDRLLGKLTHASGDSDRLRILYPYAENNGGCEAVYVHSKSMIVDDRFIKIGSANLSNRSMRVDSEIDIAFESSEARQWIQHTMDRLLAIHLQLTPEEIRQQINASGSLPAAIDKLRCQPGNTLKDLPHTCKSLWKKALADSRLLDPEEPVDPGHWIQKTIPENDRTFTLKRISLVSAALVTAIGLALLVKNGWGNLLSEDELTAWLESFRGDHFTIPLLLLLFFAAGMTGFPLNLLLVAAVTVFGAWPALFSAVSGSLLSALAGFGLGRKWGRPLIEKWNSEKIDRVNNMLKNRSPVSVAMIRLLPVAPFIIVNLVAGASHLRFWVYTAGTFLGLLPGMLGVVWLTSSIGSVIENPGWETIPGLVLAVVVVFAGIYYSRKALKSQTSQA
ncbi:MAG: VTT domain-containing protein [Verrucomicrobiales bacterium]|nr:VTT domain-containing protein [Verrucomicrobiales bacterium]